MGATVDSSGPPDPERLRAFQTQLDSFLAYSWRKHRLHFFLNSALVIVGLGLGASVILLGALNWGLPAAVVGAVMSVLFGVQGAFRFAERSNLWEVKHNDAKVVRDRVRYLVQTDADFRAVVDSWLTLKKGLLDELPRATGLEREGPGER
jgi:hypothetical protein